MRVLQRIDFALANILIILGLAFIALKILDWYNPLMDFMGRAEPIQYGLAIAAIASGFIRVIKAPTKNIR